MKKECSTCGGSGQVAFFQGVSRFLLSWEECSQCFGTGYVDHNEQNNNIGQDQGGGDTTGPGNKKKSK